MGREIKRVPMDFDWPLHKEWEGYLYPDYDDSLSEEEEEKLYENWYDTQRHDPPEGKGWQVWETVSEGSPVSPVLPTAEKLIGWMVSTGQTEEAAEAFIETGYVPSMMIWDGRIYMGIESAPLLLKSDGDD